MRPNAAAENALGTLGTVCWTIQMVPQIWKSWRTKSTEGLSPWLVLLWGLSAAFMGVYAIVQDLNVPLIVQPQLFGALCFLSWAQCQFYGAPRRPLRVCVALYAVCLCALAGFQAGVVYAVRPSYQRGDGRAVEAIGIVSSVVLSVALFPQYWEIYVHSEVVGLSVPFMAVDMLGGIFSDLSLVFRPPPFNVIAAVSYSLVVVRTRSLTPLSAPPLCPHTLMAEQFFDGIVLLAAAILNPLASRRRKRAASAAHEGPPHEPQAAGPEG